MAASFHWSWDYHVQNAVMLQAWRPLFHGILSIPFNLIVSGGNHRVNAVISNPQFNEKAAYDN